MWVITHWIGLILTHWAITALVLAREGIATGIGTEIGKGVVVLIKIWGEISLILIGILRLLLILIGILLLVGTTGV